jgi:hypothetical protein
MNAMIQGPLTQSHRLGRTEIVNVIGIDLLRETEKEDWEEGRIFQFHATRYLYIWRTYQVTT